MIAPVAFTDLVCLQLETDIKFLRGIYSSAKLLVESDSPPVYFYRFSVFGEANLSRFYGQATKPGDVKRRPTKSF